MLDDAAGPLIFGPAYLDRVIRVDRPLLDPALGLPPLDRSVDGRWISTGGESIRLVDPLGAVIEVEPPAGWLGPVGTVALSRPFAAAQAAIAAERWVRGVAWVDDLGGMGAGFAASLGGTLISALGPVTDPNSRAIVALLDRAGIPHEPVRIADHPADWTLLISSGEHGDKLPIGFRGCHAAWTNLSGQDDRPNRVRVVAALPNRVAAEALGADAAASIRAFFPNSRNMLDRDDPVAGFADRCDVLSCNRGEWIDLGDQVDQLDRVAIVAVTDGPRGAAIRFRERDGPGQWLTVPAFPRSTPIVDTNRAGEAFAAMLLRTLIAAGWSPGPVPLDLIRTAAVRGSTAAALVLGRSDFGFATVREVDAAVRAGTA